MLILFVLSWYPLSSATLVTRLDMPNYQNQSFSPVNVHECRNQPPKTATFLLERNESRRVRGTNTRSAVLDGLAAEIVRNQGFNHQKNTSSSFREVTYYEIENSAR
jgi:hypothetical protein